MDFFQKWRGQNESLPERASLASILGNAIIAGIVISSLFLLTEKLGAILVMGTFAASSLIVFSYPDSPFAQPRNVILAHLMGSIIGLACLTLLGPDWWSAGLAVALTIIAMKTCRTVHPPATSNPLVVFLIKPHWSFLLFPTLAGACAIILTALFVHNLRRTEAWPKYW
jgi:CBS-domain-containing membrane protein